MRLVLMVCLLCGCGTEAITGADLAELPGADDLAMSSADQAQSMPDLADAADMAQSPPDLTPPPPDMVRCVDTRLACAIGGEPCCGGLSCSQLAGAGSTVCCRPTNQGTCSGDLECCGEPTDNVACVSGKCCLPSNARCTSSATCCAGTTCKDAEPGIKRCQA